MKKFKFSINGSKFETSVNELENNQFEIEVNGTTYTVDVEREAAAAPKTTPGKVASIATPNSAAGTVATTKSPLPGSIVKVIAAEGTKVAKGDTILTMESMKMENEIKAECSGTVAKIYVAAGQNVMQDDKLFDIKAEGVIAAAPVQTAPTAAPTAAPKATATGEGKPIKSPLPGSIVKILVKEGQAVKRGETILTMESMKMENEIKAEKDGVITAIKVTIGQNVMQDDDLVIMA